MPRSGIARTLKIERGLMVGKSVEITQVRSANRTTDRIQNTLKGLGLGRIGKSKVHTLTPATQGMIRAVEHLVTVSEAKAAAKAARK